MAIGDTRVTPTLKAYAAAPTLFDCGPPKRTARFDQEPGFHEPGNVWIYGNARLLDGALAYVPQSFGDHDGDAEELDEIERITERNVLDGKIMVCGIHNAAHQRVSLVPLRWGAPRIVVFSGGFFHHLGLDLKNEPFRAARLWRYQWDSTTDLAISRRDPDKLPTFSLINPTIDKMIERIATSDWPGLRYMKDGELRVLV